MEERDIFEELSDIIGPDAAKRLIDYYSGSNLYIPQRIGLRMKHQQIRDEFKNGSSYRELAQQHGYTETRIRQIVHN